MAFAAQVYVVPLTELLQVCFHWVSGVGHPTGKLQAVAMGFAWG